MALTPKDPGYTRQEIDLHKANPLNTADIFDYLREAQSRIKQRVEESKKLGGSNETAKRMLVADWHTFKDEPRGIYTRAQRYDGTSGEYRQLNDQITLFDDPNWLVEYGDYGDENEKARDLVHEAGHRLGLRDFAGDDTLGQQLMARQRVVDKLGLPYHYVQKGSKRQDDWGMDPLEWDAEARAIGWDQYQRGFIIDNRAEADEVVKQYEQGARFYRAIQQAKELDDGKNPKMYDEMWNKILDTVIEYNQMEDFEFSAGGFVGPVDPEDEATTEEDKLVQEAEGLKGTIYVAPVIRQELTSDGIAGPQQDSILARVLARINNPTGQKGNAFGKPHNPRDDHRAVKQAVGHALI